MCVCVCVCGLYECVGVVCVCECMCACVCMCVCACVVWYVYVCVWLCECVCVCGYVCMCVCVREREIENHFEKYQGLLVLSTSLWSFSERAVLITWHHTLHRVFCCSGCGRVQVPAVSDVTAADPHAGRLAACSALL